MPVISATPIKSQSKYEQLLITCRADTFPFMSAEVLGAFVNAVADYIALGIAAATWQVTFTEGLSGRRRAELDLQFRHPAAVVTTQDTRWVVQPPHVALSVLRSESISVIRLNYSNPFEMDSLVKSLAGTANAIVSFFEMLNVAGPTRRKAWAEADQAKLSAIAQDALLESTVEEGVLLVERAEIENNIKEAELDRLRIQNDILRQELAERIRAAQIESESTGAGNVVWSESDCLAFANNVRLIKNIKLIEYMGIEITVVSADDQPEAASDDEDLP